MRTRVSIRPRIATRFRARSIPGCGSVLARGTMTPSFVRSRNARGRRGKGARRVEGERARRAQGGNATLVDRYCVTKRTIARGTDACALRRLLPTHYLRQLTANFG